MRVRIACKEKLMQPIILCLPGGNGNRRTDLPYTKVVPVCGTPHIFEHGRHAGQDFSVHVSNEGHDTDDGYPRQFFLLPI